MRLLSGYVSEWLKPKSLLISNWGGAGLFLLLAFVGAKFLLPSTPVDPWGLFSPANIAWVIFSLSLIQFIGALLAKMIGASAGLVLTGFLGGFVSSTAITVSLCRLNQSKTGKSSLTLLMALISSVLAMLIEAGVLIFAAGAEAFHYVHNMLALPFLTGLIVLGVLWGWKSKSKVHMPMAGFDRVINYQSVINLTTFIILILFASKFLQQMFGDSSIRLLTFLVSLFEVHGSLIASAQRVVVFGLVEGEFKILVMLSLLASLFSKLLLCTFLGSKAFASQVFLVMLLLASSIGIGFLTNFF